VTKRKLLGAVVAVALAGLGVLTNGSAPAGASSHREAPLISQDATADNTDLYLFRDPANPSMVNIVANYIGLEDPATGPNFVRFGDDVLYEIKVDNNGDVAEDITFQFRFRTTVANPNTFLYNTFTIDPNTYANQNVKQTYSVRMIKNGQTTTLATDVPTPPANIGPRSTPNYPQYTAASIKSLPGGGKVFAGSRNDPFFVDLGSVFDLLGLRPINNAHLAPLPVTPGVDSLSTKNVHSIVLQVPISQLSKNGNVPTTVDDPASVIGVYASASRQRVKTLSTTGAAPSYSGPYVQVSRLGIPLVNEVLIPLGKKDLWNAVDPEDDGQFFGNILDPEPTRLLPVVYPSVFNNNNVPKGGAANRPDLIKLLTGQLAGLSEANALPPADLLRVNLAVPPVWGVPANRLAALQGDPGGFPNGRRLTDDVVDIELRVLAGELLDSDGKINGTNVPFSVIRDGVNNKARAVLGHFPYVGDPWAGYFQPPAR
jgi:hypothetical protein